MADTRDKANEAARTARRLKGWDHTGTNVARKNAGESRWDFGPDLPGVKEAGKAIQSRLITDAEKTAGRAEMIANREEKRAAEKAKAAEAAKKAADLAKAMGESEAKSKNNRHRNYTKTVK